MPKIEWLRREFSYGYDSGDVLAFFPGSRRREEEGRCGASYRRVFRSAVLPYIRPDATVLELGPGRGSWSRALLKYLPSGKLMTVDFQDVREWLRPEQSKGRLTCFQVTDNSLSCIPAGSVDFFWSFGVLCHNNVVHIEEILSNARPKMKPGGYAAHQYAEWDKLEAFGWERGTIPLEFKNKPDEEIWWPRNTVASMTAAAQRAGWEVVQADMGLIKRDGLILLRAT